MHSPSRILIMGASYGSLLASKLLLAGHAVKLVCLAAEAQLINQEGTRVRLPVAGNEGLIEIDSRALPGVRELLKAVARCRVPCMSIMNMPPPFLKRIPGLVAVVYRHCYTDPAVWDDFDPALMTLCSPDPQAFRPPEDKINVLQVGLPTNFKAARFDSDEHTAMLRRLQTDIEEARFKTDQRMIELPVKLKVHESLFVPLSKWNMLMTGKYRYASIASSRALRRRRACVPTSSTASSPWSTHGWTPIDGHRARCRN